MDQGMQNELLSQAKAVKAVSSAMSHKQGAPGRLRVGPWETVPHAHTINKSPELSSIHLSSPFTADPGGKLRGACDAECGAGRGSSSLASPLPICLELGPSGCSD